MANLPNGLGWYGLADDIGVDKEHVSTWFRGLAFDTMVVAGSQASGRVHISDTTLRGGVVLRLV